MAWPGPGDDGRSRGQQGDEMGARRMTDEHDPFRRRPRTPLRLHEGDARPTLPSDRAGWAAGPSGSSPRRRCSRAAAIASLCSPRRRNCPCRRTSSPRRGPSAGSARSSGRPGCRCRAFAPARSVREVALSPGARWQSELSAGTSPLWSSAAAGSGVSAALALGAAGTKSFEQAGHRLADGAPPARQQGRRPTPEVHGTPTDFRKESTRSVYSLPRPSRA